MTEKLLDTVKKLGFTEKEVNEFKHEVVKAFSEMADVSAGGFLQQFCEDGAVTRKLVLTLEITRHADGEWTFFREKVQWPRLASCTVKDLGVSTWNPTQMVFDYATPRLSKYKRHLAVQSGIQSVPFAWPTQIYKGNEDAFEMCVATSGNLQTTTVPEEKWDVWCKALFDANAVIYAPDGELCHTSWEKAALLNLDVFKTNIQGIAHHRWDPGQQGWEEVEISFEDILKQHGLLSSLPID
ncbi:MAG: hypothetical protein IJS08_15790 [Victivallales bacterium]|nr:hypothetical protein [Victivallales bacterium]